MKKIGVVLVVLFVVFSFNGCGKDDTIDETGSGKGNATENEIEESGEVIGDNKETEVEEEPVTVDETADQSDILTISEELAVQMANGEFKDTAALFSAAVKAQLNEASLKQVWETSVADLGNYIDVYDRTEETTDGMRKAHITLRYDNNGIIVSYVYNKAIEIDGLWFNYVTLEEEHTYDDQYEEINISIGEDQYPVDGKLTLPKGIDNPPVIILVQGSGTHDMDETIGTTSNKPFRDLAQGLARKGIATIRYNERLYQYPELITDTITIADDSLIDAEHAINYAMTSDQVDGESIYVLGHSLGGMMAPKIAYDNQEVKGIILLAGSPRRLEDIIYDQVVASLEQTEELTEAQKSETLAITEDMINKIKNIKPSDPEVLFNCPASYWVSLNKIDIPAIAAELDIPILIAQGTEDFQVYADQDYIAWQVLLGERANVTFHLYDNLNHLFMQSNGRTDVTEYNRKANVDQLVIDDIALWINQ